MLQLMSSFKRIAASPRIASLGLGHPLDAAHRHRDPCGIRWTAPGQRHLGRDVPGSERSGDRTWLRILKPWPEIVDLPS